ncbi:hypothetical protein Tco_0280386 [Tanacetum coccineum]
MESERWPKFYTGIRQHLQKIYNGNKFALKAQRWVQNPETGTYDVESIRSGRPANISAADWDAQIAFWNDPKNLARCAQNRKNRVKSTVVCRQGSRSLAALSDDGELRYSRVPVADPNLLPDTHCWRGDVGRVLPGQGTDVLSPPPPRCTHNSDVVKLKKSNKLLMKQVNMIVKLFRSDDKLSQMLTQLYSQPEFGSGSGSGPCGDDEPGDDEDGGEDEKDADS